jgi:hypothetical protein
MLRWLPRLQVATACFSCSPPVLNFLDPYFIFMYMHNNHCHRATAHWQLNIIIIIIIIININLYYYIVQWNAIKLNYSAPGIAPPSLGAHGSLWKEIPYCPAIPVTAPSIYTTNRGAQWHSVEGLTVSLSCGTIPVHIGAFVPSWYEFKHFFLLLVRLLLASSSSVF